MKSLEVMSLVQNITKVFYLITKIKKCPRRAVVVEQLAEWSLLTSDIRGSNPNIGKVFRIYLCISVNCNSEKTKIMKQRPGLARLKNNKSVLGVVLSYSRFTDAKDSFVQLFGDSPIQK